MVQRQTIQASSLRSQAPSYFVVMIDYGKSREAIVDPEVTRAGIVARIKSHEYQNIAFIHHVDAGLVEDVTAELIDAAELELKNEYLDRRDAQAVRRLAGVA